MTEETSLHLFEGFGLELEYMIVDRQTLSVLPITDQVLRAQAGDYVSEVGVGDLCWQNELVAHVIELKTNGPVPTLEGVSRKFDQQLARIDQQLEPMGGRLMPSGMHPWMDPGSETRLWAHESSAIYQAFDRIFDCRGHGWSNLQSVHLNLPFAGAEEFGRLHAAIRLVMPIMPALSASSPVMEGRITGILDNRLEVYRSNARRIPSVSGRVIPEAVFTPRGYQERILQPMYRDIAPHDPEGILQFEWLNARGAIARFERNTIEVRVLDVQECAAADVAICQAIAAVLKALVEERWADWRTQQAIGTRELEAVFLRTIREAEAARIDDPLYLSLFDLDTSGCSAGDLWRHLAERLSLEAPPLQIILEHGTLARRILKELQGDAARARLSAVYGRLCQSLARGEVFLGTD